MKKDTPPKKIWKFDSYKIFCYHGNQILSLLRIRQQDISMRLTEAFDTIYKQYTTKFQLLVLELRPDFLFDSVKSSILKLD